MQATLVWEDGVPHVRLEIGDGPRAGVWIVRLGWVVSPLDGDGDRGEALVATHRDELAEILGGRAAAEVRRLLDLDGRAFSARIRQPSPPNR